MRAACHTSITIMSPICPLSSAAWMDAPTATASSGSTALGRGTRPVALVMKRLKAGIRVAPPTNNTSEIGGLRLGRSCTFSGCLALARRVILRMLPTIPRSLAALSISAFRLSPAWVQASSRGSRARRYSGAVRLSTRWAVSTISISSLPRPDGTRSSTSFCPDSASLADCASARSRARISGVFTFTPAGSRCEAMRYLAIAASQSSPPRDESPPVDRTSTVPLPTSRRATSKVPPPRSATSTVASF
mmetsp:Transcript_19440/g.58738  ORF Transcript_19440/g.58738 Transcript_19440/m.58738 type:complete len:247 (-) Transcript_19440:691-1431(-)